MSQQLEMQDCLEIPEDLGKNLLIAVDTTNHCLRMTREVAHCLPDPSETHVTLLYYSPPIYWEHGGDDIETVRLLARDIQAQEHEKELEVDRCFDKAQAILQASGVSRIQLKRCWATRDVADAILKELDNEAYTAVVMWGHAHSRLVQLLDLSPIDVVCRHARGVTVWGVKQ